MTDTDWHSPNATLGMYLSGCDIPQRDALGREIIDESFFVVLHSGHLPVSFTLPGLPWAEEYELVLDTALEDQTGPPGTREAAEEAVLVGARSVRVYQVRGA
jgi:glycogen operon protein